MSLRSANSIHSLRGSATAETGSPLGCRRRRSAVLKEVRVAQVERPRDAAAAATTAAAAAAAGPVAALLVLPRDAEPDEEAGGEGEDGRHDDAEREGGQHPNNIALFTLLLKKLSGEHH